MLVFSKYLYPLLIAVPAFFQPIAIIPQCHLLIILFIFELAFFFFIFQQVGKYRQIVLAAVGQRLSKDITHTPVEQIGILDNTNIHVTTNGLSFDT